MLRSRVSVRYDGIKREPRKPQQQRRKMKTHKTYLQISGKHAHPIAGCGPLTITRVALKTSTKCVSYDLKTSTGRRFGIGAVFANCPTEIFNSTANVCRLQADEHLILELQKDSDALDVEIETEN